MPTLKQLGAMVQAFRVERGLTQTQLAESIRPPMNRVLPTRLINARLARQKTVTLGSLLRLEPKEVRFGGVRAAVAQAVGRGLR